MVILFFYENNMIGGDIINISSLWNIGRFMDKKGCTCSNIHQVCSNFLSYYYGNSSYFSLFHIQMMKKLYDYFPIFLDKMNLIEWSSYIEILKLSQKECYFYYKLLLFCGDDLVELKKLIQSNLFLRV